MQQPIKVAVVTEAHSVSCEMMRVFVLMFNRGGLSPCGALYINREGALGQQVNKQWL